MNFICFYTIKGNELAIDSGSNSLNEKVSVKRLQSKKKNSNVISQVTDIMDLLRVFESQELSWKRDKQNIIAYAVT